MAAMTGSASRSVRTARRNSVARSRTRWADRVLRAAVLPDECEPTRGTFRTFLLLDPGSFTFSRSIMNKLFAALGAGYGAKKLGGGCFSTVLIFLLLYWLLKNIG